MKKGYKLCPYCGEEIKNAATKCQYCKEFLNGKNGEKVSNNTLYICFGIILLIIGVVAFLLGKLGNNTNKNEQEILQTKSLTTSQNNNSVVENNQKSNFDRDMECQNYVHLCEEKRQYIIDANYYTTNGNKPTLGIFYSPIEDTCLCYYDMEINNYDWVYGQGKYHYGAVITDAFKEWGDPTRKTAMYDDTPSEGTRCKWYSAYQGMTWDDMTECPYANTKAFFLEEVARLRGE